MDYQRAEGVDVYLGYNTGGTIIGAYLSWRGICPIVADDGAEGDSRGKLQQLQNRIRPAGMNAADRNLQAAFTHVTKLSNALGFDRGVQDASQDLIAAFEKTKQRGPGKKVGGGTLARPARRDLSLANAGQNCAWRAEPGVRAGHPVPRAEVEGRREDHQGDGWVRQGRRLEEFQKIHQARGPAVCAKLRSL